MSGKDKLISVEHLKWNVGGIKCGTLSVDYLNWILDHEEPAVDAVPVIHCKDCKHYKKEIKCVGGHYNGCGWWLDEGCEIPVDEDGYCSYAERKDNETD